MQKRFRFTTTLLKSLPANPAESAATELEFSDTEVIGLKCLSGKTGSKRFLLRYQMHGRKRSIGLGRFPDVDLSTARKLARQYKTEIAQGQDPRLERDAVKAMPTVKAFFEDTYVPHAQRRKKTWEADITRFSHCKAIWHIPFDQLTARDLYQIQLSLSGRQHDRGTYAPATINRVIALMKTVCKLAYKLLDIPNVSDKVSLLPENNARTRYLTVEETRRFVAEARRYPCPHIGSFLALLFLLGCREGELRFRKWDELNLPRRTLVIPHTKNGTSHTLYLSDLMVEIIQSIPRITLNPYIFAGTKLGKPIGAPRKSFQLIKERANIPKPEEVVLHTARHTVGSLLVSNGVPLSQIQKALNHKDIASTQRYAKLSEDKQRETANYLSDWVSRPPM